MIGLWGTVIPIAVASAILPVQVVVHILTVRSSGARARAGPRGIRDRNGRLERR
jgi:hypothetical protein